MKPGLIQRDMTKHFSDEALHAWYWCCCIEKLGAQPLKLREAYQDQYLTAAGMPANLMEVLAITQVFERRVIQQYARHSSVSELDPLVRNTLRKIMEDEKWHIEWVGKALRAMESDYGKAVIEQTLKRFREADQDVYRKTMHEHEERIQHLTRHTRPDCSDDSHQGRTRNSDPLRMSNPGNLEGAAKMPTKNIVKEKIASILRQPLVRIQDDALLTDLATESLVLVEMVIELQEDLGVRLVQEDLKDVKTVADLAELFESRATK